MTLNASLRAIVRAITPIGLLDLHRAWRGQASPSKVIRAERNREHEERHQRIETVSKMSRAGELKADQYEKMIEFLVEQGVCERDVREGSIPRSSLEFVND